MSRPYNPYPKRRNAKGRAEMRRQRILHRILVAMREVWETSLLPMIPPDMPAYEGPALGDRSVQFIREGGDWSVL